MLINLGSSDMYTLGDIILIRSNTINNLNIFKEPSVNVITIQVLGKTLW